MAETANISEIAEKISDDIFKYFHWKTHPSPNQNFPCLNDEHKTESGKNEKQSHPSDVVFYYDDPYLPQKIYFHTDLKSYGKKTIKRGTIKSALSSLAMTVECASVSDEWRSKYLIDNTESYEVRGLLFVYNHDKKYEHDFNQLLQQANLLDIPIKSGTYLHVLGTNTINHLYTITNDIIRLQHSDTLSKEYSFYYPDMVLWKRRGDVWGQPATIETLTAPYFIIKHKKTNKVGDGFLIYYGRSGSSSQEFEYLLDSLSRFQMLNPETVINLRVFHPTPHENIQNNFYAAKERYNNAWGSDPTRKAILDNIRLTLVDAVQANYSPGQIGWERK